ncbi:hypothetical protein E4L99_16110 [Lysinibacillus sp. S2017]|nr:hypothetical protein E4L99_16110 [Lysinibacillus sp. S2017]
MLSFAILQCIFILLELTGWVPRLKEIDGCQNANIKGIWFNPHMTKNTTTICA